MSSQRQVIATGTYAGQSGGAAAIATLVCIFWGEWRTAATPAELGAVATLSMWLFTVAVKELRDRGVIGKTTLPVALVLMVFLVACAGTTPRQKFYMGQVAFSGAQSAAMAYLRTPYGERADEDVWTAISEASAEGTMTLERLRPMVPNPGQEVPDLHRKLLDAGFDTMDSIVERLNRTVLAPEMYREP
jgi:hypothetical protein